ncbi:sugar MFS transporter [Simiduia agarivorans]|uniref:Glucose/galactose transporter n=1 Tax=Simiduia agarivorans (strain DSM 21679 / JCM 13881 / BCRC 17597 / SA1) TaxID=1117647 RepID=K4KQA1_SIMAS|nr:sugar MFS transporter [Simiduia agarivorans]AFV00451.1 glucose/galactose transporter [Simiduia agarivorans SA1 = DSM 21679]
MNTNTLSPDTPLNNRESQSRYWVPLCFLTILFFLWGFITALNDILIPHLQDVFTLTNTQAMLVQFAFFIAYFVVSLVYFLFAQKGKDLLNLIGYQNGLSLGLFIMAAGCLLFRPAASLESYGLFLFALFVLAGGMAILQIAANPYVSILGRPETASGRLNLSQALNSLGTTLAPIIGGILIFSHSGLSADVNSVAPPYTVMATTLFFMAVFFKLIRLPAFEDVNLQQDTKGSVWQFRHLTLGAVCIFMYVGAEVALGSILIKYLGLPDIAGMAELEASIYLSLYWAGLMVGRFLGAIAFTDNLKRSSIMALFALVWALAFGLCGLLVSWTAATIWAGFIALNIALMLVCKFSPNRTLMAFASVIVLLLAIAMLVGAKAAMWCVIAVGLFNSIMWSNVFTLAINNLGRFTSQGSSMLIMAILGAALVPPLMGLVADLISMELSLIVPLACYLYVIYYGLHGYRPKQH